MLNNKLTSLTKTLTKQAQYGFAAKELVFGNTARAKML